MSDKHGTDKTIIEQIIQETFLQLTNHKEYTQTTIDELNKIASSNNLTSSTKVIAVLKSIEEAQE